MGFCLYLAFVQVYANCLTLTNSYGDYITDCCRNFFTHKCIPYVAHTTSHTEYQLKEIYLCSYVWNHLTWMSTLIFTSFLFCYITPWHLAALKSWGEKKKTPLMLHCKTSKQSAAVIDLEVIRHWIVDPDISFYSVKYCCCSAVWLHR